MAFSNASALVNKTAAESILTTILKIINYIRISSLYMFFLLTILKIT